MNAVVNKEVAINVACEKFAAFEWLTQGLGAKSPQYGNEGHSTGEKPIDYQDRLGAIAAMKSQLAKSVTSLIIYDGKSESDYEYVRNHLAKIMADGAYKDKRKEPEHIAIYHLSWLVAQMVIEFSLNPLLEGDFTAQGRLVHVAKIDREKMSANVYRLTWKPYENLMAIALEIAIKEAEEVIIEYKKNTYKEVS